MNIQSHWDQVKREGHSVETPLKHGSRGGHVSEWDIHSEQQSTITLKRYAAAAQVSNTKLILIYE